MKLNTDGSWRAHNDAGGGGVFRGATGNWYVGFSSKFNALTPLAAELHAMREGLLMAQEYEIQNLEIETDADALLTMLGSVNGRYNKELKPLLSDVAGLMGRFKSLIVKHISRANNKVAHALAHYALDMAVGHRFFLNPPPFANIAYQGDIQKLEDAEKRSLQIGSGSGNVIDLDAIPSEAQAGEVVTTEILFGTIPATVTSTIVSQNQSVNAEERSKKSNVEDKGK